MAANDTPANFEPSNPAGTDEVEVYEEAGQARAAVKLLTNHGYTAEQIFVLCTDEKRRDEFQSRLMPAGAPQLNSAPSVVGSAGAALGATIVGGASLAGGPAAGVAGAMVGAAAGAGVGVLLGAGTYSDDETNALIERHRGALADGKIVVVVRPRLGAARGKEQTRTAADLLAAARSPRG